MSDNKPSDRKYLMVPVALKAIQANAATAARAMEFAVLTVSRASEAADATWDEFNVRAGRWVIRADRRKAGRERVVPLVGRALEILRDQSEATAGKVFPNADAALTARALMELRMRLGHTESRSSFRSLFRKWALDQPRVQREAIEAALETRCDPDEFVASELFSATRKLLLRWDLFATNRGGFS